MVQFVKSSLGIGLVLPGLLLSTGCAPKQQNNAQAQPVEVQPEQVNLPLVDVAIAQLAQAPNDLSYTGATVPIQTIALRSRVEGELLQLTVDVGDSVNRGQVLAQLDNDLLLTEVGETKAELAAREFEVEQAKSQLAETHTQVEQAKAQLQQAKADADRLQTLAEDGAISLQDAEVAQTHLRTAEQILKSAQEHVKTRERAVLSVERRVAVQTAIVKQAKEQLTYATLESPLTGMVLNRMMEPGDLVQPGEALVEIGDLSAIDVNIQISDRDLSQFALGQVVQVSLDAFPNQTFTGEVTQISPVADPSARLIPIEVTIANPDRQIGSGLMARVSVATTSQQAMMIPESALNLTEDNGADGNRANGDEGILFVSTHDDVETAIEARTVQLGKRDNGQVEILSGLQVGEIVVVNSDRRLTTGQTVRLSFLSES